MTNIERVRKTYHITDETYTKIMDLMDEARAALKGGEDYDQYIFERKMRKIVVAPADEPEYDYHMVIEIVEAFGLDGRWEEVYPSLYKDDTAEKSSVAAYLEKKHGVVLK